VAVINKLAISYCIMAKAYEMLGDQLEDVELAVIVKSRKHQPEIDVDWDELFNSRIDIADISKNS